MKRESNLLKNRAYGPTTMDLVPRGPHRNPRPVRSCHWPADDSSQGEPRLRLILQHIQQLAQVPQVGRQRQRRGRDQGSLLPSQQQRQPDVRRPSRVVAAEPSGSPLLAAARAPG